MSVAVKSLNFLLSPVFKLHLIYIMFILLEIVTAHAYNLPSNIMLTSTSVTMSISWWCNASRRQYINLRIWQQSGDILFTSYIYKGLFNFADFHKYFVELQRKNFIFRIVIICLHNVYFPKLFPALEGKFHSKLPHYFPWDECWPMHIIVYLLIINNNNELLYCQYPQKELNSEAYLIQGWAIS